MHCRAGRPAGRGFERPEGSELTDPDASAIPRQVRRSVRYAQERKGGDITVLDLRHISSATDFFVIVTGRSDIQVRAIADHVLDSTRNDGNRPDHVEGLKEGRWVLLDYIDYVVHIFHPAVRDFYRLEALWGDARSIVFDSD